jgi:septum formation protein
MQSKGRGGLSSEAGSPTIVGVTRPLDLVLASTSRYRRDLLARLGLPFRAVAPLCDEEQLKRPGATPRVLAEELALAKAESLATVEPHATIIGADQIAALDELALNKPGSVAGAVAQLTALAGRTHVLITAVAVTHHGRVLRHTDVTRLSMRRLTAEQIAQYVAADEPLDCAGSYRFESRGIALFDRLESADPSAIIGLPLMALASMLIDLGYSIP